MKSRKSLSSQLRIASVLTLSVAALTALETSVSAAAKTKTRRSRPITRLKFDPTAERVEFFAGVKNQSLSYRYIAKDSHTGRLLIENKTDKPLTVELPPAVVGVQVLAQGIGMPGAGGAGVGGQGGLGQGGGQQGGQNQSIGGGQQGGGQGLGQGGQGQGFFSIPAESTVAVPFNTVCLEHGKKDPNPKTRYRLVKVEEYTKSKELHKLLEVVASGRVNRNITQAAAWHLANNMSWRQLATKQQRHFGRASTPYFHPTHVAYAQKLVAIVERKVKEDNKPASKPTTRQRTTRRFRR